MKFGNYIFEFCIDTEKQGKGLGTEFLNEIQKFLLENNIKQIFLQTERTVSAYKFYLKNGFIELTATFRFIKIAEISLHAFQCPDNDTIDML